MCSILYSLLLISWKGINNWRNKGGWMNGRGKVKGKRCDEVINKIFVIWLFNLTDENKIKNWTFYLFNLTFNLNSSVYINI